MTSRHRSTSRIRRSRRTFLRAVVESFVLREGTDYGEKEVSLDEKVAAVMRQIKRGDAQIIFDPVTESVAIQSVPSAKRPR